MQMLSFWENHSGFPKEIWVDGKRYSVSSDFRVCMRILKLFEDTRVFAAHKCLIARSMFFRNGYPKKYLECIMEFLLPDRTNISEVQEKVFDFYFDAEEIYGDFLKEYSVDLLEIEHLHWWKFLIMLKNLSQDCAFKRKIGIRLMDIGNLEGDALERALAAKEKARLPEQISPREYHEIKEFKGKWASAGERQ